MECSAHPLLGDPGDFCGSWERRRDSSGVFLWLGRRSSDCSFWSSGGWHHISEMKKKGRKLQKINLSNSYWQNLSELLLPGEIFLSNSWLYVIPLWKAHVKCGGGVTLCSSLPLLKKICSTLKNKKSFQTLCFPVSIMKKYVFSKDLGILAWSPAWLGFFKAVKTWYYFSSSNENLRHKYF